ncbi:TetR/AcrR family transcriptional regulator [Streptomyces tsukubensis]|uniref:TetR family transcriptional regulator n=1 Tax=Streptomyces tsukubensis TaxID=83656 RepID=A0A1V4A1A8_9ACTN|nr:TetR/AcrR family transcriptional regulator [Streptomyces tsukubensis]OON72912.1 TetR family transcriptional regulator [Streptomyces tsukubensis]QFR94486.1 TetR family transcriptional regulator [Streptomyces tsukubensis]
MKGSTGDKSGAGDKGGASNNRRAEYAALTRQAIIDAARKLFSSNGFFATRVEDIAAEARVAPATVYAVGGGKHGLLHTLIQQWTTAPVIASTYAHVAVLTDAEAILRATASGTREVRAEWGDVMRVVLATAPHDARAAQALAEATDVYRKGFVRTARRLADIDGLRQGTDLDLAVDVLWFYFGYASYFTCVDENGWSLERAEQWLLDQARAALL